MNILQWCDNNISYLKNHGVEFKNGFPVISAEQIYNGIPKKMIPYSYKSDVPVIDRKHTILTHFDTDEHLIRRLDQMEADTAVYKDFGGMSGMDISPSVGMLRPRQKLSLLISLIYTSFQAVNGVLISPNARMGDFGTTSVTDSFPIGCSFSVGQIGCVNHGFRAYGLLQLKHLLEEKSPEYVLVYGGLSVKDAIYLCKSGNIIFYVYPGRRAAIRDNAKPYTIAFQDGQYNKFENDIAGGVA